MANFDAQVIELVGSSWTEDQDAVNQFITEGANEVINAMPRSMQERVAEETSFTNTTTSEGSKILHVLRNDGTIDQPCRKVPAANRGRIQDSSDMEYATATDPAYYIQDALVTIFPTGTGKLVSIPTYSQSSPLDASAISTITNFPNEAEYLVVLYAAVKALQQAMNGKSSSLPTDVTLPSAPVAPSIATVSYTDATNADATAEAIVVPAKIDVSGDAPSFVSPADFSKVTSYIETDEDTELATAKIQQISVQIDEAVNKFNKENVRYQTEFQEEVTKVNQDLQAEIERFRTKAGLAQFNKQQDQALNLANAAKQMEDVIADNSSKLQKYSSELQKYQAEVGSEIQNYNAKIQKHVTDYQWLAGQYQSLSADYQRGLQLLTGARAS